VIKEEQPRERMCGERGKAQELAVSTEGSAILKRPCRKGRTRDESDSSCSTRKKEELSRSVGGAFAKLKLAKRRSGEERAEGKLNAGYAHHKNLPPAPCRRKKKKCSLVDPRHPKKKEENQRMRESKRRQTISLTTNNGDGLDVASPLLRSLGGSHREREGP